MRFEDLEIWDFNEDEMTWTPGVVPDRALVTFVATRASMVSEFTMDAEPVKELRVAVP